MRIFLEVKAAADDSSSPNGTFEAVLSDNSLDRDGEIVDPGAFDPLPVSIPIYTDHEAYTLQSIVGRATPYYDGAGILRVKGFYASTPWAQQVRTLVNEKVVTSMSCGFGQAVRQAVGGVPHITKAPLYEGSFVGVPANTNALVTAAKSAVDKLAKTFQRILDRKTAGEPVDQSLIDEAVAALTEGEEVTEKSEKDAAAQTAADTAAATEKETAVAGLPAEAAAKAEADAEAELAEVEGEVALIELENELDDVEDTDEIVALEEVLADDFDDDEEDDEDFDL